MRIGIHVVQLRRYEAGTFQPTLDVIRKLATALSVSADLLLFGKDERAPTTICACSSKRFDASTPTRSKWCGPCWKE